jgi:3-keto-L-gulonate-6-phosphate decarboxylase
MIIAPRTVPMIVPLARIAVAGGITPDRLEALLPYAPEIVIVGAFVSRAEAPRAAALAVRAAL